MLLPLTFAKYRYRISVLRNSWAVHPAFRLVAFALVPLGLSAPKLQNGFVHRPKPRKTCLIVQLVLVNCGSFSLKLLRYARVPRKATAPVSGAVKKPHWGFLLSLPHHRLAVLPLAWRAPASPAPPPFPRKTALQVAKKLRLSARVALLLPLLPLRFLPFRLFFPLGGFSWRSAPRAGAFAPHQRSAQRACIPRPRPPFTVYFWRFQFLFSFRSGSLFPTPPPLPKEGNAGFPCVVSRYSFVRAQSLYLTIRLTCIIITNAG